jgi:hypothetical protein
MPTQRLIKRPTSGRPLEGHQLSGKTILRQETSKETIKSYHYPIQNSVTKQPHFKKLKPAA